MCQFVWGRYENCFKHKRNNSTLHYWDSQGDAEKSASSISILFLLLLARHGTESFIRS